MENAVKTQILRLENRENFTVGLVENVESFSEEKVILKTGMGTLLVTGSDFVLEDISMDSGSVSISGKIDKMEFIKAHEKHGFLKSMFK